MSFEGPIMLGGVYLTVVKRTVSCFQGIYVKLGSLREFYPWLMLDDVKNLVNRQFQGSENRGILSLRYCRKSILLVSWGVMSPCTLSRAIGLEALGAPCGMAILDCIVFSLKRRSVGAVGC